MASLNLSHDELRAVEQTRLRLSQLSHSIGSLKTDVLQSNPLPNMDSLQASAKILENNMESLIKNMNQNSDVFSRVAVHPSTNFPGRTQEGILLQLLRKKPEPDVAAAMDQGRDRLASVVPDLADLPLQQQQYPTSGFRDEDRYGYGDDIDADAKREREKERELERLRAAQITTIRDLESTWNASRQFFYDSAVRYAQEQAEGHLSDDDEDEDEDGVVMGGMSATDGDDVVIVDRPPPPPALDVTSPNVEGVTVENLLRFSTRAEFVA